MGGGGTSWTRIEMVLRWQCSYLTASDCPRWYIQKGTWSSGEIDSPTAWCDCEGGAAWECFGNVSGTYEGGGD